jgi:leucyl/phenylalanyl-tRNA--protein transferase
MAILQFPPVESADEHGILGLGGDLEPESLLLAYQSGIFPWPLDDETLAWFAPPTRAVVFLSEFHVSRSLTRSIRHAHFTTAIDRSFSEVIGRCAEVTNRGEQDSTWITPELIDAYITLHQLGFAHSFETYFDGALVGGIYGVQIGRLFAAESSFYRRDNASKVAMLTMVDYLRTQDISWFDCQVLTPFSKGFGAREISRAEYMELLGDLHQAAR